MIAILNPRAGGGRGKQRWGRIGGDLRRKLGVLETVILESGEDLDRRLGHELASGHTRFLAAGGDGTVNAVVDSLLRVAPPSLLERVVLGAVGLGSSNDFHKPARETLQGVPCRIDFDGAALHDVGLLRFLDAQGTMHRRHWILNASVGTTAEANRIFNEPGPVLRVLKRTSTSLGIAYAAMTALLTASPRDLVLWLDDRTCHRGPVRNLGFVKSPHFAGNLVYDSPFEPASGTFFVHCLGGVSLPRLVGAFVRLSRGRWRGTHGARSWRVGAATVSNGGAPFPVEFDGEVIVAREASFSLLPRKLRVCP
jgi:diacylglycerol kinase family enzyme